MTNYKIIETKTVQIKKPGTKTVWQTLDKVEREVSENYAGMVEESCPTLRRLGGTETITRDYTSRGYRMVKLVSKCPDGSKRIIREYAIQEVK